MSDTWFQLMPGSTAMPKWKNPSLQCARAAHTGYSVTKSHPNRLFSLRNPLPFLAPFQTQTPITTNWEHIMHLLSQIKPYLFLQDHQILQKINCILITWEMAKKQGTWLSTVQLFFSCELNTWQGWKKERKIYTSVFTMMLINLCINSTTCQVISV